MKNVVNKYDLSSAILHTDRGSQFRSYAMKEFCDDHKIIQSMTDGYALWQNAIVETFFKTLKQNYYHGYSWKSINNFLSWMHKCLWNYNNVRYHGVIKSTPNSYFECAKI